MQLLPLEYVNGHLFVIIDEDNWLVDTGAHVSYFQDRSLVSSRSSWNDTPAGQYPGHYWK